MEAVLCPHCGRSAELHRIVGFAVSADRRHQYVFRRDDSLHPEQVGWVDSLIVRRYKEDTGGTPTLVEKTTHERDLELLQEMHDVELNKRDRDIEGLGQKLFEAERRIGELESRAAEQKRDLIDTGRKLIVARDRLGPVEKAAAEMQAKNIDLERRNAALEERIRLLTRQPLKATA